MKAIDSTKIFEAKRAMNTFLAEHPEMRALQEQIELALQKVGKDPLQRSVVLQQLMLDSLRRLGETMQALRQIVEPYQELSQCQSPDRLPKSQ